MLGRGIFACPQFSLAFKGTPTPEPSTFKDFGVQMQYRLRLIRPFKAPEIPLVVPGKRYTGGILTRRVRCAPRVVKEPIKPCAEVAKASPKPCAQRFAHTFLYRSPHGEGSPKPCARFIMRTFLCRSPHGGCCTILANLLKGV